MLYRGSSVPGAVRAYVAVFRSGFSIISAPQHAQLPGFHNTARNAWYCVLYVFVLYYVLIQIIHGRRASTYTYYYTTIQYYSGVDGRSTSPAAAKLDAWPMASTSKEEKPTAPLLPAVQPAPLSTAVQLAAVQQVNKLDIAERHEQTLAIFRPHKEELRPKHAQ